MDKVIQTALPALRNVTAFKLWIASGQNVSEVATQLGKSRRVVNQWRIDQDWEGHADALAAEVLEDVIDNIKADGSAALIKAQALADYWLDLAGQLATGLGRAILKMSEQQAALAQGQKPKGEPVYVCAEEISAARLAADTAITMNDKLYSWSRVKVEHSGKVELVDAAEQARIEAAVQAHYGFNADGSPTASA